MQTFILDLRLAIRSLRTGRLTTVAAIATIALGIGAATSMYSVVEGVLIHTLPFRDPGSLVDIHPISVQRRVPGKSGGSTASDFTFQTVRSQSQLFEDVAGYAGDNPILTELGEPERVNVWAVQSNFFGLLGVQPMIGRTFTLENDAPGGPDSVVLSYALWTTRFGKDPAAVGRHVILNGQAVDVIGVMPPEMNYPAKTAMWRSFSFVVPDAAQASAPNPQGRYWILARLKPGVTIQRALSDFDDVTRRIATEASGFKGWTMNVVPLHESLVGATRQPLLIMLGAVAFVLFVACANIANLLLARVTARQREISIRLALGSSRLRIARQFLTEALVMSIAGGVLGIAIAVACVPAIVSLAGSEIPGIARVSINMDVLLASAAAMLVTGILFGFVPALHAVRKTDSHALRQRSTLGDRSQNRAIDVFVILQIAMTVILLSGAGLLVSSFARLVRVNPGVDPDRVISAKLTLPAGRYSDAAAKLRFADDALARLRGIPGVVSATVSTGIPLELGEIGTFTAEGNTDPTLPWAVLTSATPDFFRTFGITLMRGQGLDAVNDTGLPVVVNERLVRVAFPGVEPIGKHVTFSGKRVGTIVGVVSDTIQTSVRTDSQPQIILPLNADPEGFLKLSVRTDRDPKTIAGAMRSIVREIDPVLPIDKLSTVRELISESLARDRFYTTLLVVFSGLTLMIAAAGIFSMVTFMTTRRTPEFGIRLALGAMRNQILSLALRRAVVLTGIGLGLGLVAARWTSRLITELLFGIKPDNPAVLAAGTAIVLVMTVAAGILPAWRATRIDPTVTLRLE